MKNKRISEDGLRAIESCINGGITFVCFRLPQGRVQLWIAKTSSVQEGFIFRPFNTQEAENYCFQALKIYELDQLSKGDLQEIENLSKQPIVFSDRPYITPKEEYLEQIQECLEWLGWQQDGKVILSRIEAFDNYNYQSGARIFAALEEDFPSALCYLLYSPQTGYWCGAFQEHLLESQGDHYYTEALAGTRKNDQTQAIHWSAKEQQEHRLVAQYLKKHLQQLGVSALKEGKCNTVESGQIVHLQTPFTFQLSSEQVTQFIDRVHPSPAICGLPKEEAFRLIQTTETHQRLYYSGLVGLLNYEKQTQLFVNLRCMQLLQNDICIYAGGGLTKESQAETEWEETNWKINNVMNSIQKYHE